jgi:hypothetical protein
MGIEREGDGERGGCELAPGGIDGGKYIKSRRAWRVWILVLAFFFLLFVKSLQNQVAFSHFLYLRKGNLEINLLEK